MLSEEQKKFLAAYEHSGMLYESARNSQTLVSEHYKGLEKPDYASEFYRLRSQLFVKLETVVTEKEIRPRSIDRILSELQRLN